MKNINYIALISVALVSGLSAAAQNLPAGTYEGQNGIAYRKSSTLKDGTTDTYIVNLETFVYGEVKVKNISIPADIVLVLDVSGSMSDHIYQYNYRARTSQSYSYRSYGDNTYYYKHTDGKYYPVSRGSLTIFGAGAYFLRYNVNGTYYYLTNGTSTTEFSYVLGWTNNTTIWTGVLYEHVLVADLGTKLDNLKTAVNAFIDKIQENDLYDDDGNRRLDANNQPTSLGNQISIVKFASASYYNSSSNVGYNSDNAPITEGDHDQGGTNRYNYTEVVKGFTATATDANITTLKNAVNTLHAGGATAGDYGLNLARLLFEDIKDERTESSKTVVFFTDGEPTHGNTFDEDVASHAIGNSYSIKSTYDASVYTVGVFGSLGDNEENVHNYMNYVSSNYPDARDMSQPGNPVPEAKRKFYQNVVSGTDLTSVFTSIAEASGGSGATEVTAESAVTVDVVASSFSLPEGIDEDDITVTVAPCIGQTREKETLANGKERFYFTFGVEKASTEYGMGEISVEVDEAANMVSTSGFDFSTYWCGKDGSTNPATFHGYKQTISFEIKLKEGAVGGPNVVTNDKKSGIYVNGNPVAEFNRPTVKVPVSIWIKKIGLTGEDSAVFNIRYADYDPNNPIDPSTLPKSAWKSFTKVIVNCNSPYHDAQGNPMIKLVGLDPDYYYSIKEDAWAWTYTYRDGGLQFVYGEDQQNPFVFTNTPKTDTVKDAEATVQNVFNANTTTP